jgi:hypothetical protein
MHFDWSIKGYAPCHQMCCGGCYSSSPDVLFPIKSQVEEEDKRENDPLLHQRMMLAWGKKHRAPNNCSVGHNGDHFLVLLNVTYVFSGSLKDKTPPPETPKTPYLKHVSDGPI